MSRIYIIQHCQSEHHINDLTGGWTDTPLTKLGENQAVEIAKELRNMGVSDNFDLFSSDLLRASMTAEKIEHYFNKNMILDKSLREHNNGQAAEKTKEWAKHNILFKSKGIELDKPLWVDAETFRELFDRMKEFNDRVLKNAENDIVIVSHGVAIGYLIMSYLNMESDALKNSLIAGNAGGISILKKSPMGQNTLNMFNSISHLVKL
jgi:probable phosphoglycerate mutase